MVALRKKELEDKGIGKKLFIKFFENFAAILGMTYVIGFIIVNSYFNSFGINSFSFLKTSYLTAGFLFIVIFLIFYISINASGEDLLLINFEKLHEIKISLLFEGFNKLKEKHKKIIDFINGGNCQNCTTKCDIKEDYYKVLREGQVLVLTSSFIHLFFLGSLLWVSINFLTIINQFSSFNFNLTFYNLIGFTAIVIFLYSLFSIVDLRKNSNLFSFLIRFSKISFIFLFISAMLYLYRINVIFLIFMIASFLIFLGRREETRFLKKPISLYIVRFTIFLISLVAFGQYSYGNIKSNYGGGFPSKINIIENNKDIIKSVYLIDQTEKEIIIKKDKQILQLNKNNIKEIEYIKIN